MAWQWLQAIGIYILLTALHGGRPLWFGVVPPDEPLIHLPNCVFSLRCLKEGVLPLWNPYTFSGLPHLASHHAAALYPPVYLFFGVFAPFRALSLMQEVHYFLIGLGVWALLRFSWRLRQGASLAGGVFFMLSGFTVAHEGHSPMIWAIAWIPWILLFSQRTLAGIRLAGPVLAMLLAIQVGAGYMQMTVLTCIAMGAEALVLGVRPPWPKALRRLGVWGLAVAVGMGLMMVQFVATRELLPMTFRGNIPFSAFTSHGFPLAQLPTLFFPLLFGASQPFLLVKKLYFSTLDQSEMIGSMGAGVWVGLLLLMARGGAGAGQPRILRTGLRRRVFFWVALAFFSALALVGARSPLNLLLYHVPVFNLFRVQNRWMVFIDLALAMLAAVGIDRALGLIKRRQPLHLGWAVILGLIAFTLSIPATWTWIRLTHRFDDPKNFLIDWPWFFNEWYRLANPALWLPLSFGLASILVLALLWKHPRLWKFCLSLWIGLYALEQGVLCAQVRLRKTLPVEQFTPPGNEAAAWLLQQNGGKADDFRIFTPTAEHVSLSEESMPFTLPQLNGLYGVGGNWPLMSPFYGKLLRMQNIGSTDDPVGLLNHPAILNMLNIRYLLIGYWYDGVQAAPYRQDMPTPGLLAEMLEPGRYPWLHRRHQTRRGITIFENSAALPRAWTVQRLIPCRDHDEVIARLWDEKAPFDPAREAYVMRGNVGASQAELDKIMTGLTPGTVRITERRDDRMRLEVSAPKGPTFLVISEAMYPGWWARLDGQLVPIYITDAVLRGIYIPQGTHQLYLRYLPSGFVLGLKISLLFALVWLIWVIYAVIASLRLRRKIGP